jgi:hypothetical protein
MLPSLVELLGFGGFSCLVFVTVSVVKVVVVPYLVVNGLTVDTVT